MTFRTLLLTSILCTPFLISSSFGQAGPVTNQAGGIVGHAANRTLGALMLLNIIPLE